MILLSCDILLSKRGTEKENRSAYCLCRNTIRSYTEMLKYLCIYRLQLMDSFKFIGNI